MKNNNQNILLAILAVIVVVIGIVGYLLFYRSSNPEETNNSPTATSATAAVADDNENDAESSDIDNPTPPSNMAPVDVGTNDSVSGSWYQLYFTNPIYPDNPKNHTGGLDTHLVDLMNKATKTLDVADYDFDLADVAAAMVKAKQRGVVVRMVTDSDTINNVKNKPVQDAFAQLKKAGIPYIGDNRGPIMHNKFTVVDNQYVETGSWNYTDGDTYHLNNNMIIINSPQLAANYTAEFNKMFVDKTFGPNKKLGVPNPTIKIGSTTIQNYFASEDNVVGHILDAIKPAQKSIYFLAFSFTQDDIGKAIIAKQKAGLTVGGVFETTGSNTPYSEYGKMKKAGLDVYTDGNPWVMHHKVIIIDEQTVIFGSFNFSDNANKQNDENLLIIQDPTIAKAFKAEYDRVLALAKNPPVKKKSSSSSSKG